MGSYLAPGRGLRRGQGGTTQPSLKPKTRAMAKLNWPLISHMAMEPGTWVFHPRHQWEGGGEVPPGQRPHGNWSPAINGKGEWKHLQENPGPLNKP